MISGALISAAGRPPPCTCNMPILSAFNLSYSVSALAMALIGGTAHWIGPVPRPSARLDAAAPRRHISSEVNVLVLGIMLVLFVVVAPRHHRAVAAALPSAAREASMMVTAAPDAPLLQVEP